MPNCTITRTHRNGVALRDRDFDAVVSGPIEMATVTHPVLKRAVTFLTVVRRADGGADMPKPIPDLYEPQLVTFGSDRAMMVSGFEDIGGQRVYQGWWIQWV